MDQQRKKLVLIGNGMAGMSVIAFSNADECRTSVCKYIRGLEHCIETIHVDKWLFRGQIS